MQLDADIARVVMEEPMTDSRVDVSNPESVGESFVFFVKCPNINPVWDHFKSSVDRARIHVPVLYRSMKPAQLHL